MLIQSAKYIASNVDVEKCPKPVLAEYAFVGRSNVGKSSLINLLIASKKLAKISKNPGKTQTINHFLINEDWYLVDLPGYGYAKVSKSTRKKWQQLIKDYLTQRKNLLCIFLLIDSRIPPQQSDLDFANWLGSMKIPFALVFTKADKPKGLKIQQNIENFKKQMLQSWQQLPQIFITSIRSKAGKEEILDFIEKEMPD